MVTDKDPFESLLGLEDEFFQEGFGVGVEDGKRAGLVDGRLYGLEHGFEKYIAMGRLHGRARFWAGRVSDSRGNVEQTKGIFDEHTAKEKETITMCVDRPRLRTHVRTLYALTEPESLATENNEVAVADFDDRLKRAEGKIKVIEKLTGESSHGNEEGPFNKSGGNRDGGIEDTSVLNARH